MSSNFFQQVQRTIKNYNLLEQGDIVLVGVSGGPDSIALLYILNLLKEEYDLKLHVVHINHMFRGEEAKKEAQFVQKITLEWGLVCEVFEKDVPGIIKAQGLSPQEAGHKVRKNIYLEVGKKIGATKLALGHHADDRAETVLLHLIQGTGSDGLASMPPKHGWLIRPLAEVDKKAILDFCQKNKLIYTLDPSNEKPVYLRNKIRLELLPYLKKEFNPQIVDNLLKLEDIVMVENDYLEIMVGEVIKKMEKEDGLLRVNLKEFKNLHSALQRRVIRRLYKILKPEEQNLNYVHVKKIEELIQNEDGFKELHLPEDVYAKKSYSFLELGKRKKGKKGRESKSNFYLIWEVPGELFLPNQKKKLIAYYSKTLPSYKDYNKVVLDGEKIKSPLIVRQRRPGDRISPLGLEGSKKLKSLFIDRKIEREKRDLIPIVCFEEEIIWLPGLTLAEEFKATATTKRYLILEMVKCEYV